MSFAVFHLGLTPERFYALPPRMFIAIHRQWREARRAENRNWALLRVDLINHSLGRPDPPVKLEDLMPGSSATSGSSAGKPVRITKKRRSEIADSLRRLFAGFQS